MIETPRLENVVIFFQIIKLTNQLIQRRIKRDMSKEKDIAPMDFAECLGRSGASGNSKVY